MSGMSHETHDMLSNTHGMGSNSEGMSMMSQFSASLPTGPLWFSGWQPRTAGTTFAACLGLFGLTMVVKMMGAFRHQASLPRKTQQWHDVSVTSETLNKTEDNSTIAASEYQQRRSIPAWASHQIIRGIFAGIHAGLEYFLMLAVMSYNVYFFLAIVFGHFVGEVMFGRFGHGHGSHS
ncbi:uncharacterized protein MELLADRAFT_85316 [Melampsora larici-populina 98AG31]|uniref:Copper transport protein n=1 Tax=Melampsora larici-populina (strain 98AG31 / pathotype 3-4-7) TaxID=747676 RepID=F4RIC1_MELLP|nr:uncharacterized protein MELLADRAFT_85316 [Melampsora larici-populina 98AG31]EGG07980.1 hypothetical protein MELLADRAFT_85316 [Melampsora larici-populina 98AG31]